MNKIIKHEKKEEKKSALQEQLEKVFDDIEQNEEEVTEIIDKRNSDSTIELALDSCQHILFSTLIKPTDEATEIEKEYNGGTDFHKKVQQFAKKRNASIVDNSDAFKNFEDSIEDTGPVEACKRLECKERGRCNLQFLIEDCCVWSMLFENINNVKEISRIIYSISKYMEVSEKQIEDKFTF